MNHKHEFVQKLLVPHGVDAQSIIDRLNDEDDEPTIEYFQDALRELKEWKEELVLYTLALILEAYTYQCYEGDSLEEEGLEDWDSETFKYIIKEVIMPVLNDAIKIS